MIERIVIKIIPANYRLSAGVSVIVTAVQDSARLNAHRVMPTSQRSSSRISHQIITMLQDTKQMPIMKN